MPAQPLNDDVSLVLDITAVSGIDPTTPSWQVSPRNLVDSTNFLPDKAYGALTTALGRGPVPGLGALTLPGPCFGIALFYRFNPFTNRPPVYIMAIDIGGAGTLWAVEQDGSGPLRELGLPIGFPLTASQQTFFAESGVWMFMSNGTDTPLKIDNDLNVTQWGIVAPTDGPTVTGAVGGKLSYGEAPYYYCVTYGHTKSSITDPGQESSQGKVVGPFTLDQTPGMGSIQIDSSISGIAPMLNIQFVLELGGAAFPYGTEYTTINPESQMHAASVIVLDINTAPPLAYTHMGVTGTLNVNASLDLATPGKINIVVKDSTGTAIGDPGFVKYYLNFLHSPSCPIGFADPTQCDPANVTGGGTDGSFVLTDIPISADDQVDERNIYRLGGGLGQWRLVTTLHDNTTTTYTDTTSDDKLTGQALTVFRDPPPPFRYICTHQQRVFGFNSLNAPLESPGNTNNSSSLWWSNYGEPWGFDGLNNVLQVGESLEGDPGVGMASIGAMLGICKKRTFYALYGNSDDTFSTGLFKVADIGCASPQSICSAYGMMGWVGRQGAYIWNGTMPQNLSDGAYQQSNIKNVFDQTTEHQLQQTIGFMYGRMVGFCFPNMNRSYVYDSRGQGWWPLPYVATQLCYNIEDDIPVTAVRGSTGLDLDAWFLYGTDLGVPLTATGVTRITSDPDFAWSKVLQWFMVDSPMQSVVTMGYQFTADPGPNEVQWPPSVQPRSINFSIGLPRHWVPTQQVRYVDLQLAFTLKTTQPATVINRIAVYAHKDAFAAPEGEGTLNINVVT